ncbi:MAG: NYN domain-containing protein, partial [Nocardioides sp.]|nr:NYN domain-containing protein [Nocardioides sp.]
MTDAGEERSPGGMPALVRARVLVLSADALPRVSKLPPQLRKVAAFAPARRAKLGGSQIAAVLETDAEFREHVTTQIAVSMPVLVAAVTAGEAPEAADPVDVAALLWIARPEGWEASYDEAVQRLQEATPSRDVAEVERLQSKLETAEQANRGLRADHKAQAEQLKAENTSLRRKLGEARASLRAASSASEAARVEVEQARDRAEKSQVASEAEARRLRGQREELNEQLGAARRDARSGRDEATLRARLLLDTLLEAGQGLRRELALPAVTGSPGNRVEAEVALAGSRTPSSAGAFGPSSPVLLEQYLAMPRARLIIDGYNVSKAVWPESTLEAQRIRLLNGLGSLIARTGAETTVVFDAASASSRGVVNAPRGVKVLFSPEGVIADDVIRDLVDAEPEGRVVI